MYHFMNLLIGTFSCSFIAVTDNYSVLLGYLLEVKFGLIAKLSAVALFLSYGADNLDMFVPFCVCSL